ncbi:unnamed protein product [Psylliodes chrysocephalus]|uniref:Uncharacterized protein n=1 Tax=Psylliodes chrysocephalus TaxID=3402493 RepID=A0A9P0CME5_9CUCU|nr:unnamed protein product [Psylliodes chrysocephala]
MLVQKEETKRQRNTKDEENQEETLLGFTFYKHQRVCKIMFLNTLGINEGSVIYWKNDSKNKVDNSKQLGLIVNNHTKGVKDRKEMLIEFFRDFPKIESDYCRTRSSKFYLDPVFESKSGFYKFYKSWCHKKSYTPV